MVGHNTFAIGPVRIWWRGDIPRRGILNTDVVGFMPSYQSGRWLSGGEQKRGFDMDKELEKAIDDAGREAVRNVIRANGLTPNDSIPEWIWQSAVRQVKEGVRPL